MPKISIIILTCNSEKYIKECLDSVFSQDYPDFEVILVDNGSEDNTLSMACNYALSKIIRNDENLGASKARNQGIEASSGKWILTLDSDVVLEESFLRKMAGFADTVEDRVGMLQPKILMPGGENIYSCGIKLTALRRFHDIGRGRPDDGRFSFAADVFGGCSAACLYRRDMLDAIKEDSGYFDERFFFLVEDVDLSWRAQKKGWHAKFYPGAICYHYGNSSNCGRAVRQYLCFRNRYYMLMKNQGMENLLKRPIFLAAYDLPRFILMSLSNPLVIKALKEARAFAKGNPA